MGEGSIIVISDCHLGLVGAKSKGIVSEPDKVGQFLNWLINLKKGEKTKIKLGPWGNGRKEKVLKPPEKLLLIGDILELWDATDRGIDYCSRPIFDLLNKLNCEKIYLLGNHDYDLKALIGTYPSGENTMSILEDYYPIQEDSKSTFTVKMGSRDYIFVHGYQFDKLFTFQPWKKLGGIRSGALAFGDYGDLFVGLFFVSIAVAVFNYILMLLYPLTFQSTITNILNLMFPLSQFLLPGFLGLSQSFWSQLYPYLAVIGNVGLIILWLILGGPRFFYLYARKIWNKLVGTRYNRDASVSGILSWWNRFAKNRETKSKDLRIVYGHTHLIDVITPDELSPAKSKGKEVKLSALNIPSWVKDYTEKHKKKLRGACLYIDDEDELFIGWNWVDKKYFVVPIDVVHERMKNGVISKETAKKLMSIDWPKVMVDRWESEKLF